MYVKLKCNYKEKKMKKLLVILMLGAGLNAYAGGFDITNSTDKYLAAKCFPSGKICNGIAPGNHDCKCPDTDDVMYFGRVGMSSSTTTADLNAIKVFTASDSNTFTGYHNLGNGNIWLIPIGIASRSNSFTVEGDPGDTIDCLFAL